MNRMKKVAFVLLISCMMAFVFAGCGAKDDSSSFAGKWVSETDTEYLEFFSDGTGVISHPEAELTLDKSYPITEWAIKDGKLTITYTLSFLGNQIIVADYSIDGDKLQLEVDGEVTNYSRIE